MNRLRSERPGLSGRELQVLTLVADGKPNKAIAKEVFVSEATVKSHRVHIFNKLDVDSHTAAVTKVRNLGLVR